MLVLIQYSKSHVIHVHGLVLCRVNAMFTLLFTAFCKTTRINVYQKVMLSICLSNKLAYKNSYLKTVEKQYN